jgi:lipopolysaccharide transport system permease protein
MTLQEKKPELPVVVYTPESQLRHPGRLLRDMWGDLRASRELAWRLFVRNISAQYRQSVLGYLWAFLPPLFTTLVWVFLNDQKILNVGQTDIPYPVYVLLGTLLWQGFVDALNSPLRLVSSSKDMLAKINFPREALILAGLGEVLFNFFIRLILLIVVFIGFGIRVPWTVILAPIGVASLIALGLMIGILLTPLGLLYGDIQRGLAIITSLWFYLTPVVYSPPTTWPASLLAKWNPVSPLLVTTRELLTKGIVTDIDSFILVTIVNFFLILLGWLVYRLAMPHLIERMSA